MARVSSRRWKRIDWLVGAGSTAFVCGRTHGRQIQARTGYKLPRVRRWVWPKPSTRLLGTIVEIAASHPIWRTIGVLTLASAALSCHADFASDASVGSGIHDRVRQYIDSLMSPGSAAFVIPSPIARDESVEANLKVSALGIAPEDIQRGLESGLDRSMTGASAGIRLANRMVARLTTVQHDAAEISGDPVRAVSYDEPVEWTWSVTPIRGGDIDFRAVLEALVDIDGSETPLEVGRFDAIITVHGVSRPTLPRRNEMDLR